MRPNMEFALDSWLCPFLCCVRHIFSCTTNKGNGANTCMDMHRLNGEGVFYVRMNVQGATHCGCVCNIV